jgi:hypothetical protein
VSDVSAVKALPMAVPPAGPSLLALQHRERVFVCARVRASLYKIRGPRRVDMGRYGTHGWEVVCFRWWLWMRWRRDGDLRSSDWGHDPSSSSCPSPLATAVPPSGPSALNLHKGQRA